MTRTTSNSPAAAPPALQPSYALHVKMSATEARPFIRVLFRLIQHYMQIADLRGSTTKTGYRLQHESSFCDFAYHYDAKAGGFNLQTQFKPGASNALAGRILTLVGLIVSYHEAIGTPLALDMNRSKLHDLRTLKKWGDWGVKQLAKQFPKDFPELLPKPEQSIPKVRF